MKISKVLLPGLALLASVIFVSCSCGCGKSSAQPASNIPDEVFRGAERYIMSVTGRSFFEENIFPDYEKTKKAGDIYSIFYRLIVPGKDYINEEIHFVADSTGKVLKNHEIRGIPDCKENPAFCEFNLSRDEAVGIAKNNGLADGKKEWQAEFRWNGELNRYVWHILSVKNEASGGGRYRGEGEEMMIAPNNGEVLMHREWEVN